MIRRRAKHAGIKTKIGCHTFRDTGITAYLENGGTLEHAQQIAAHESPRTTKLYDRTGRFWVSTEDNRPGQPRRDRADCDMIDPLMNWDFVSKLLTAFVAIYGAALSTYTLVMNRREKRRRVDVSLQYGFTPRDADLGPMMLLIQATNPGHRTVTLHAPYLLFPRGKKMVFMDPQGDVRFPHNLVDGTSCTLWVPATIVAGQAQKEGFHGKIKLAAQFQDAVGGSYKSSRITFDIDDALNA